MKVVDPLQFQKRFWPNVTFYDKQREIIYSAVSNDETIVPAGHMLGKDYVAAFIAIYFFFSRNPVKIITTSVKDDHLRVLWGEINNYLSSSSIPLRSSEGGPFICNHHEIKKIVKGNEVPNTYIRGMVANDMAAMQGHHIAKTGDGIPRTMFMADEASGVPDEYFTAADTWANCQLIFGNTWECNNKFKHGAVGNPATGEKGGDVPRVYGKGFERKIIKIRAIDSPNVRYGLLEQASGRSPTDKMVVPGVISYYEYLKRRRNYDKIKAAISLDADFYEGAENRMFPPEWRARAHEIANRLLNVDKRLGKAIGCDPAEGGDSSCWSVVNEKGLIKLDSLKTPDTNIIPQHTITLMKQFDVRSENVWFDRGGGGKQHVDRLRSMGYRVNSAAFGEAPSDADLFKRYKKHSEKREDKEDRTTYKNRRAEMYGLVRNIIDPSEETGFGIPSEYYELDRQLTPIPLRYDREGVMYLLPKNKAKPDSDEECLRDLLGCSPDEADSFALAVFGLMMANLSKPKVGAVNV